MLRMLLAMSLMLSLSGCGFSLRPPKTGGPTHSICDDAQGTYLLGLSLDTKSYAYSGKGADPLVLCANKPAIIETVKNTSGYDLSLAHDSSLRISMDKDQSTDFFKGQSIAGDWSSFITVDANKAPPSISLKVTWRRP